VLRVIVCDKRIRHGTSIISQTVGIRGIRGSLQCEFQLKCVMHGCTRHRNYAQYLKHIILTEVAETNLGEKMNANINREHPKHENRCNCALPLLEILNQTVETRARTIEGGACWTLSPGQEVDSRLWFAQQQQQVAVQPTHRSRRKKTRLMTRP